MLSLSNDYKNRNFRLDRLDEDFQEYARENLITDEHKLIYARDDFDGSAAIIVVVNPKYHKLTIHRMFKIGANDGRIVHSTDIDTGITERGESP